MSCVKEPPKPNCFSVGVSHDPLEMIFKEVEKSLSAPLRVCDVCNTADEAISYAIHLGLVDCNFDARDMAELLLSEVQK